MNSWGILGNPTKDQILEWQNLPYGKFKNMTDELKKLSKGKSLRSYSVEVKKTTSESQIAFVKVSAFNSEHAILLSKAITDLDWFDPKKEQDKISYRVSQVWD